MKRIQKTIYNIKYGLLASFLSTILKFITRTVMIYVLGAKYVGMDSLLVSLIGVLNLSELGISSAINYSLYKPVAEKDYIKANQIINFYKTIYRLVGIAICIIGITLIPFLRQIINDDIPNNENIYILYLLALCNTVIGYFLFAYKNSIFIANLQSKEISNIRILSSVLQNFFQIIFLLLFENYLIYMALPPIFTALNNLLCSIKVKKIFPHYFAQGDLVREERNKILKNVKGLFIQKIGSVVFNSVDSIVISALLSLNYVAMYGNYFYVIQFLWSLLGVIENTLISSVGNSIAIEQREKNYRDFKTFNFLYVWIISVLMCCLLCGYQSFMFIWVGKGLMFSNRVVILFVIYFYVCKMGTMGYIYKEAAGIWTQGQFIPLITAIINLILNIILTSQIGIEGILLSSIVSMGTINFLGYLFILFKNYFCMTDGWLKYILKQYIYMALNFLSAFLIYIFLNRVQLKGLVGFIGYILVGFIWQNMIMFFLYRNSEEFKAVQYFLKNNMRQILKLVQKIWH